MTKYGPIDTLFVNGPTEGTSWPYKPTNETYKSGKELIETLVEVRAKSIRSTPETKISVLGQNDEVLDYQPTVLRAMHAQRLCTNRAWPNPVVIKPENVLPGLEAPQIETGWSVGRRVKVNLLFLGGAASVEVSF